MLHPFVIARSGATKQSTWYIRAMDCFAALAMTAWLPRDFLDTRDQFVDRLVDWNLLAHHAVHRLGPGVLVVQDGELVVLDEVERRGAAHELGIDRLAVMVGLPERALLSGEGHRKPAAQRAFDIGLQVFFLQHEFDELFRARLVLG